jgi:hypothetical protein
MKPKTTTISVRVPIDFKETIQSICDNKGITISDYCITKINPSSTVPPIKATSLQKLEMGGITNKSEPFKIPNEIHQILGLTGGFTVGVIVFKALSDSLQKDNPEWSEERCTAVALIAGIGSALLGGYSISQISKYLSK